MLLGGLALLYSMFNPSFDVFTCLSGLSSFFVAILTVLYVSVTSSQLDLMSKQLDEMKKDRELQTQPFPLILNAEMILERPLIYAKPREPKYRALSRSRINIVLKNIGSSPAVCIDTICILTIPSDEKIIVSEGIPNRINILEENCKFPSDDVQYFGCMFTDDFDRALLKSIMESTFLKKRTFHEESLFLKNPRLTVRILYKNILGASFVLHNEYIICEESYEDQDPIFKNWLSQLMSFKVNFGDELNKLELTKAFSTEWCILLGQMNDRFQKPLQGDVAEGLSLMPIAGSFSIKPISEEEYNKATDNIFYVKERNEQEKKKSF